MEFNVHVQDLFNYYFMSLCYITLIFVCLPEGSWSETLFVVSEVISGPWKGPDRDSRDLDPMAHIEIFKIYPLSMVMFLYFFCIFTRVLGILWSPNTNLLLLFNDLPNNSGKRHDKTAVACRFIVRTVRHWESNLAMVKWRVPLPSKFV